MADGIQAEAEAFATLYAALFSSPACSSPEHVAEVATRIGQHYRPGVTFFTNGQISRFVSIPIGSTYGWTETCANIYTHRSVGGRARILADMTKLTQGCRVKRKQAS